MKNAWLYLSIFCAGMLPLSACKDKCENGDFGIQSIQPAANPAGYEIFIACKGVSAETEVRFDEVAAASVKTAEGGLIVKIPTGVSGAVSLSIQEGNCSDSKSFDVLSSYPSNAPASPTTVIIPQNPGSYPSDITNAWANYFDNEHFLFLQGDFDSPDAGQFDPNSNEFHISNAFFNQNPISGTYDIINNKVLVIVDRSAKSGGFKDTLTGSFIPNLSLQPDAQASMLLTSKRTGRQLVIFKPQ